NLFRRWIGQETYEGDDGRPQGFEHSAERSWLFADLDQDLRHRRDRGFLPRPHAPARKIIRDEIDLPRWPRGDGFGSPAIRFQLATDLCAQGADARAEGNQGGFHRDL